MTENITGDKKDPAHTSPRTSAPRSHTGRPRLQGAGEPSHGERSRHAGPRSVHPSPTPAGRGVSAPRLSHIHTGASAATGTGRSSPLASRAVRFLFHKPFLLLEGVHKPDYERVGVSGSGPLFPG